MKITLKVGNDAAVCPKTSNLLINSKLEAVLIIIDNITYEKNLPEIVKDWTLFSSKLSYDKKIMIQEK
ncbi:MAG: hypothetical protein ACTS85_03680 [Arsenophonus sp. NC-PG7-MAG3]